LVLVKDFFHVEKTGGRYYLAQHFECWEWMPVQLLVRRTALDTIVD